MQFFHLFSFVVVASYAAALPQPAGQSEKYSNNVDATLASGLEARSYQPGLNSYKDSATLTSLKRRDNSGSGSSLSSTSSPNETLGRGFTDDDVSIENISSTIDRVGDGIPEISVDGELAGKKFDGTLGDKVARYIRRNAYVNAVLAYWAQHSVPGIRDHIKSVLGEDEYSKVEPSIMRDEVQLLKKIKTMTKTANGDIFNISRDIGILFRNLQRFSVLSKHTLQYYGLIIEKPKSALVKFPAGQTLYGHLSNAEKSIEKFAEDQDQIYREISNELEAAPSE
ncbi:hypothetical protein BASA61_000023 [Batrachochytrium salamandrivorans]|nr:hypothetical protein BASA61_000023 [Batrachochytrium salamandrivorans]KAH9247364.1 hypothetical protein BASA81_015027 [Batrachochytrium salamandrivorans]